MLHRGYKKLFGILVLLVCTFKFMFFILYALLHRTKYRSSSYNLLYWYGEEENDSVSISVYFLVVTESYLLRRGSYDTRRDFTSRRSTVNLPFGVRNN